MFSARMICVLFACSLVTSFSGCGGKDEQPTSEATGKETPAQELWGSTVILSVRGHNRAKVWAGHILKFEESRLIKMDEGIRVDFYDEHGDHISVLTAENGEVDETTQDLTAVGNVVVVSDKDSRLESERLQWHHGTQKIVSDTLVTIRSGDEEVTGVGFESDADLEHWSIREDVSGIVRRKATIDE